MNSTLLLLSGLSSLLSPAICDRPIGELVYQLHWPGPAFAYESRTTNGETTRVERFDPAREKTKRWDLVLSEGQPPSGKELAEYREKRTEFALGWQPVRVAQLIDLQSLQANTSDRVSFNMRASEPEEAAFMENVQAEIVRQPTPSGSCELHFKAALTEPVSPVTGVRVNKFSLELRIAGPRDDRPYWHPVSRTMQVQGRAFLVKKLDRKTDTTYIYP